MPWKLDQFRKISNERKEESFTNYVNEKIKSDLEKNNLQFLDSVIMNRRSR